VIEAFRSGLITRTSLIANLPASSEAIALAREHLGMGTGVHLNLTCGLPVAPPERIASLLRPDGSFPAGPWALAARLLSGRIRLDEVHREWEGQIARLVDAGVRPSHLDGHHHVHLLPGLTRVAAEAGRRFAIRYVRIPRRILLLPGPGHHALLHAVSQSFLNLQARRGRAHLGRAASCDTFLELPAGMRDPARIVERLRRLAREGPEGITEVACHPGYAGPDLDATAEAGDDPEMLALADPVWRKMARDSQALVVPARELAQRRPGAS
jgi:predicted glycoside hydrolase/deacetylase ChbG (UPF0249 family)